jgi:LmbE family N-acetylglucosaminyl deacetylase
MLRVFPDQRADALQQIDINKAVEDIIADAKPYVVYTHWVGDLNKDHRMVAEAVGVAAGRPGKSKYVRKVYAMQPEYPALAVRPWKPTIERQIGAAASHKKQVACMSYSEEVRSSDGFRMALAGNEAESFMEIR